MPHEVRSEGPRHFWSLHLGSAVQMGSLEIGNILRSLRPTMKAEHGSRVELATAASAELSMTPACSANGLRLIQRPHGRRGCTTDTAARSHYPQWAHVLRHCPLSRRGAAQHSWRTSGPRPSRTWLRCAGAEHRMRRNLRITFAGRLRPATRCRTGGHGYWRRQMELSARSSTPGRSVGARTRGGGRMFGRR